MEAARIPRRPAPAAVLGVSHTVERKMPDGRDVSVITGQPTHSGVDVTDGTYRVTSIAPNSAPSVIDASFP